MRAQDLACNSQYAPTEPRLTEAVKAREQAVLRGVPKPRRVSSPRGGGIRGGQTCGLAGLSEHLLPMHNLGGVSGRSLCCMNQFMHP